MTRPLSNHYYHGALRKTVIAFGSLFANIKVFKLEDPNKTGQTRSSNGSPLGFIEAKEKVSLEYAPKEKYEFLLSERENVQDIPNIPLPRMVFEITSINYDPSRKQSTTFQYQSLAEYPTENLLESTNQYIQYVPVPYVIGFSLHIFSRGDDSTWQILEQILPLFQPDYTVPIVLNEDTKEKRDISFVYRGMQRTDNWKGTFQERRYVLSTLNFDVKTCISGPIQPIKVIVSSDISIEGLT